MTKPKMPAPIREQAERAVERHMRRPAMPSFSVIKDADGWCFQSPYDGEDGDHWFALLCEGFGTRSQKTVQTFLDQLADLCPTRFDDAAGIWAPDEDQLVAAVQIVRSLAPRNEAEACLAAQMVAVHMAAMKVGKHIGRMSWPDERSSATLSKLARTYAQQMETMQRVKGKRSSTRQKITVKYERHDHKHVHMHQEGGAANSGGQPHATRAGQSAQRAALPSPDPLGQVVPLRRCEGEEGLSHARRGSRIGRADG